MPIAIGELLLEETLAWMECRVVATYPGGDHTIFLSEVVDGGVSATNTEPLIYFETRWLKLNA